MSFLDETTAPEEAAAHAGLHYVSDRAPGYRRVRRGRGFSYVDPQGLAVRERAVRERIDALAVPPAWTDVWICRDARGHLQATGRDARGRKQYRYHERWREVRDAHKYDRLTEFGRTLPDLRRVVERDLARRELDQRKVTALVVRLLDETLVRVGNEEYAEDNETYGLTTLESDHVELSRAGFSLCFVGKGGREHQVDVGDRRLARLVWRCHELGGKRLFTYRGAGGDAVPVGSSDVNEYLHREVGVGVSAKDFRTWGGTVTAASALVDQPVPDTEREASAAEIAAVDRAAEVLGNTRAVARRSYVHPVVLESFRSGELQEAWRVSRAGARIDRRERAVLVVLDRAQGAPSQSAA